MGSAERLSRREFFDVFMYRNLSNPKITETQGESTSRLSTLMWSVQPPYREFLSVLRVFTASSDKTRIIEMTVRLRSDAYTGDARDHDPARRRNDGLARTSASSACELTARRLRVRLLGD